MSGSRPSARLPRDAAFLLAVLIVAIVAAWPLLANAGLLNTRGGGDSPFLLQRLHQLEAALRDGHFPVRWMPDAYYGYGYPFYNYYAPLSIYIAAAFRFLGFSYVRSIELAQLAGFAVAACGMYALALRWLGSRWAGLLGAVAYTFAPFHMVNVYVRGDSLAEFWAMAFYPLVILTAERFVSALDHEQSVLWREAAVFAITYAALILSHNISALIFSPFLLLYLLLRWFWPGKRRQQRVQARSRGLLITVLALLLAFALAAWFFLPALAEQGAAQLEPVTEGYFHYSNHFRGVNLVQPSLLFDYSVGGGNAFRMGLVQAAGAVAGLVVLSFYLLQRRLILKAEHLFIILALLVATFMVTPLSRVLWDTLPLLPFTQFPWRFLSVQAFAAALVTAALALLPSRRLIVPVAAAALVAGGLGRLETDHLILTDADVTVERLVAYEWFTGNVGTTVSAEYLPPTVEPRAYTSAWLSDGSRSPVTVLSGELLVSEQQAREADRQVWTLRAGGTNARIMLPTLHWPGWRAEIDGTPVSVAAAPGSGLITTELPPGEHTLTLFLARTPIRLVSELVSLAALLLTAWLLVRRIEIAHLVRPLALLLSSLAVLLLLAWLWPEEALPETNLNWDYAQMAYLHHAPDGVAFSNGTSLREAVYDEPVVQAGQTLGIDVHFAQPHGETAIMDLVSPAAVWPTFDPPAPALATQTKILDRDNVRFELTVPENAPEGLWLPRLRLDGAQPLMTSGDTRGDLLLRPVRVVPTGVEQRDAAPGLDVRATSVAAVEDGTLDVQLAWFTAQPLTRNYKVSLRLLNPSGAFLSQLDVQPGYGFRPSTLWRANEWTNDRLSLALPEKLTPGAAYPMVAVLYDAANGAEVLTRRLGTISLAAGERIVFAAHAPRFDLPPPDSHILVEATFGDALALRGYQTAVADDALVVTLVWQAVAPPERDYTRFVHLLDDGGGIVAQADSHPLTNSYPTSQWAAGEVVVETLSFALDALSSPVSHIGVGFYETVDDRFVRLPAVAAGDVSPADDRVVLPVSINDLP